MRKTNYTRRGDGFSRNFMSKVPNYNNIIEYARKDKELDIKYRGGYLNIYYLGGKLLKLSGEGSIDINEFYFYLPERSGLRSEGVKKLITKDYQSKAKGSGYLRTLSTTELKKKHDDACNIYKHIKAKRDGLIKSLIQSKSKDEVGKAIESLFLKIFILKNNIINTFMLER